MPKHDRGRLKSNQPKLFRILLVPATLGCFEQIRPVQTRQSDIIYLAGLIELCMPGRVESDHVGLCVIT